MSYRDRLAVLRAVRELASCDDAELSALTHFMDEAWVAPGTVLAQEGRLCHQLLIVAAGRLEACVRGRLVLLGPGEAVGWDAMRDRDRHDATVVAISEAHLLVVSHEQFRAIELTPTTRSLSPPLASAACRRLPTTSGAG